MKRPYRYLLPLLAVAIAIGIAPHALKADNPIVKPRWMMPRANSPGNNVSYNCNPNLLDTAASGGVGTNLRFGDCFNQNTLLLRLTGSPDGNHPYNSAMQFIDNLVQDKLLRAKSGNTPLFSNYIDLMLKRLLDATDSTYGPQHMVDYDPATYLYKPANYPPGPTGQGGYDPGAFSLGCLNIPLVGNVCLNAYLWDVDNEPGQVFFSYDADTAVFQLLPKYNEDVESEFMVGSPAYCDTTIANSACGIGANIGTIDQEKKRDDDDGLQVNLTLNNVMVDLLFEPPAEWSLTDIKNSTDASYAPEKDLSNYLKAWGKATLGTVQLSLAVRVVSAFNDSVQPHSIAVGFELQNVTFDSDFQFAFNKGPYCNNNLGTVGLYDTKTTSGGGAELYNSKLPLAQRPFKQDGTPNFAYTYSPLVSDVVVAGVPALQYFAAAPATWPTAGGVIPASAIVPGGYLGGGSGIGRDRIGANAGPYQFEKDANGKWYMSDNPNNCRYPADACTVTATGTAEKQDGGVEYSGISSNCEYTQTLGNIDAGVNGGLEHDVDYSAGGGNVSNDSDDSTYKISEQITSIIPYIQGEIKVTMEDKFKNRTRPNPGYYLGPTSLLDLGATLAGLSFDWPLRPGTDYVFLDALLDSDVDNDSTNEFWADDWGVMMPFNFALGVSWNSVASISAPVDKRLDLTSCVQKLPAMTGYSDGFGEFYPGTTNPRTDMGAGEDPSDDPFLTRPMAPKAMRAGVADYQAGILSGFHFPVEVTPYSSAVSLSEAPSAATESYAVGLALHQNVLSAAIYDAVVKGLLCVDIDASGEYAPVTDQISGGTIQNLLKTSNFGFFFPQLTKEFGNDRPMRLRVIPLLRKYTHDSACAGNDCSNGIAPFAVTDQVLVKGGNYVAANDFPTDGAHPPYVIMGGPPISMGLTPSWTDPTKKAYVWPDLSIVIPNLLLEFYVKGKSASDPTWYRVFAIDMGVTIGLNIDIVKYPSTYAEFGNTGPTAAYQPTYYPIGCDPNQTNTAMPNYCSGGSAYTKRVLRLAGIADPEINAIIEYSELSFGNVNGTTNGTPGQIGGGLDYTAGNTTVTDAFTNYALMKNAISNLLGVALSMDLDALAEIGFDLGAFLNVPIAIDAPYIGPSYVAWSAGSTTNATDREAPTPNGFGDYLVAGVSVNLDALTPSYLIQQINYMTDYTTSTHAFGMSALPDLLKAPAAKFATQIPVPQATILPPEKVSALDTVFHFTGYDAKDGTNVQYSWRVDNGVWSLFSPVPEAHIQGLLEGKHTLEVKAINSEKMMQDVPARYTFVVDSIAPEVRVVGDRTVGSRATYFVEANDYLTPQEDIRVAYRLDSGRWSNYGYNKKIALSGLREGRHTLRVKAADNAGNIAETAFNFAASTNGFGCSTVPGGAGSLGDVLVLLLVPAAVLLRKRLF